MRFVSSFGASSVIALAVFSTGLLGASGAMAASPEQGKAAFIRNGCWQCHDFAGEGSIATSGGRVIARTQLPLDAFKSFVRNTNGQMPPFRAAVLSDDDLDNIYAYLQSLPEPKAVSDIPLLKDARSQ